LNSVKRPEVVNTTFVEAFMSDLFSEPRISLNALASREVHLSTTQENRAMVSQTDKEPMLLLTPRTAATALAISPRKLWELTNRREIACVRIGRSVRYRPEFLAAYLDNLETMSA
jgi:excisionase family DNA binding protein